jgi:hypothetical protein
MHNPTSSEDNATFRQRLPEASDALLGDAGLFEVQRVELVQAFEMPQTGVGEVSGFFVARAVCWSAHRRESRIST